MYRASRERIPVFPIEWLLLENIKNHAKSDLDLDELRTIRDNFTLLVNQELRSRKKIEDKMTKFLISQSNGEIEDVAEELKK